MYLIDTARCLLRLKFYPNTIRDYPSPKNLFEISVWDQFYFYYFLFISTGKRTSTVGFRFCNYDVTYFYDLFAILSTYLCGGFAGVASNQSLTGRSFDIDCTDNCVWMFFYELLSRRQFYNRRYNLGMNIYPVGPCSATCGLLSDVAE